MATPYDVAIIGAGADGLAAAILLARARLNVIVIERHDAPGGLATTVEFHPGFRASPWLDECAGIPASLYWQFDLARRGAILVPAPHSTAVWPDKSHMLWRGGDSKSHQILRQAAELRGAALRRGEQLPPTPNRLSGWFKRQPPREPWPGEQWALDSLRDLLVRHVPDTAEANHVAALALNGRSADPFLAGSALHLLAPAAGMAGVIIGGPARLTAALLEAAKEAGVEFRHGLDAADIRLEHGRAGGVVLVDGSDIEAAAILSTLDVKRTFLSLFPWQTLPHELMARAGGYRSQGSLGRVLFALKQAPVLSSPEMLRGPIHVAPTLEGFVDADMAWRAGRIPDVVPATLRLVSALDPGLAPPGGAVLTATLSSIPYRLFDGAWTKEKRDILRDRALATVEAIAPGVADHVLAAQVITPHDIEETLGFTGGDVWGGEIAADQMFDLRPWPEFFAPRTPIEGLYLAGPSTPLGPLATCAAACVAVKAILADRNGKFFR